MVCLSICPRKLLRLFSKGVNIFLSRFRDFSRAETSSIAVISFNLYAKSSKEGFPTAYSPLKLIGKDE